MSLIQRINGLAVLLSAALLVISCGSDESRYGSDSIAVAETRIASKKLNTGQRLSSGEFVKLKTIYDKYPQSPTVRTEFEKALVQRKDWASLVEFYLTGNEIESDSDQKKNLAKAYVKIGKYSEALEIANGFNLESEAEMRAVASTSQFYLGKHEDAKKLLDSNWKSIVDNKSVAEMTTRGLMYFYDGENKKAVEILETVDQIDPGNVTANNALGRVYSSLGNSEKALAATARVQETFDKLTEKEQQQTRNVERLYKLQDDYKAKRYQDVIVLAKQLIPVTEGKNKAIIYQYLYNSYRATGKENEAREILQTVQKLQKK